MLKLKERKRKFDKEETNESVQWGVLPERTTPTREKVWGQSSPKGSGKWNKYCMSIGKVLMEEEREREVRAAVCGAPEVTLRPASGGGLNGVNEIII